MLNVFRHLLVYLRPYRWQVVLLFVGLLVDLGFTALMPMSLKVLIDSAIEPRDAGMLWLLIGVLVGAVLIAGCVAVARDYLYARLGTAVLNDLRLRMFEHLQRLSASYYARTRVGDIMSRFSTDLLSVQNAVVLAVPDTILGFIGIVLYSSLLFYLEWQLALITVLCLPLLLIGPRVLGPRAEAYSYKVRDEEARCASQVQENINAQPVIRAFGLAGAQVADFRRQLDVVYRTGFRFNLLAYLVERSPNVSFLMIQLAVTAIGSYKAFSGTISIGTLVSFNALTISLSGAVTSLTRIMPALLQASGGIERIAELLAEPAQVADASRPRPAAPLRDAITLEAVDFSYTGERKNLESITLRIPRGASVALVGGSGSGKSTVLSLVTRFYDVTGGKVCFDGVDVREFGQASLRAQMGIVFQESFLFNTTIRDNIRMGWPEANNEQIEAAARAAEIHDLIVRLPDGYDTIVGERGSNLSGGQRQRVAIARALVRDPAILILDEATSALDPATEAAVNATLERIGKNRTVISVTHRLAGAVHCDQIFVFDHGRLIESGTHDELLDRGGSYRQLWNKQSGLTVSGDGVRAGIEPERLKAIPILAKLGDSALGDLAKLFISERLEEARTVFREGDTAVDKFYIIARGKVAVTKHDPVEGERHITVLQDGDHFGEIALIKDLPRTATIRTLTPCIFLTLQRGQFLDLVEKHRNLRQEIDDLANVRMKRSTIPP
ncbi:MAG TPA: ABC transporter transmembrane domain-containing protein, partial [Nannocystaceae bacterium]|nr:ABC transporter transmembrane domain-containing protein [Nannocystaceae bacterium]